MLGVATNQKNMWDNLNMEKGNQNKNTKSYGLLSMMAMIIGVVIGSGIFAKNAGLITTAGSVWMVTLAWIVTSLIIVTLVIAFMEVISITEMTGEQSTVNNWGKHLMGHKFGKSMGYYMTYFYFPITIAALFQYSGDRFLSITPGIDYGTLKSHPVDYMGAIMLITVIFMVIIMLVNTFFTAPGKYFQNIGTVIKTIPLFFIIVMFIFLVWNADIVHFPGKEELLETNPDLPDGNPMMLLLATMPAILFSFDGYLMAGELSNEAKGPSHFRLAFVFSIIFIIIVYLLFSIATLGLGDPNLEGHGEYGSITNAIYSAGNRLGWSEGLTEGVSITTNFIVLISMLTGASGFTIAGYRAISDMSATQIIKDKRNIYVKKNKHGIAQETGIVMMGLTFAWFTIAMVFDLIIAETQNESWAMCDFASNMITVGVYFLQTLIIGSALINRFKPIDKQVKVKKNPLFIPCAIISSFFIALVTFGNLFAIFIPLNGVTTIYWLTMLYTLIVFILWGIAYWYNSKKIKELTSEDINRKDKLVAKYYEMQLDEYLEMKSIDNKKEPE